MPKTSWSVFLSLARDDAQVSPELADNFQKLIPSFVNGKMVVHSLSLVSRISLTIGDDTTERTRKWINEANFFLVVYSPNWLKSDECLSDFALFRSNERSNHVIVVSIEDIDKHEINSLPSSQLAVIDEINSFESNLKIHNSKKLGHVAFFNSSKGEVREAIDEIAERIKLLIVGPENKATQDDGAAASSQVAHVSLPGIMAFSEKNDNLYVGRETEVDEVLSRLNAKGFAAVIGGSGSGKTSLLQAGVSKEWRAKHEEKGLKVDILRIRPGSDPFLALVDELKLTASDVTARDELAASLQFEKGELTSRLRDYCADNKVSHLLIIIEQFEELFLAESQKQRNFLATLVSTLEQQSASRSLEQPGDRLDIAISIRADRFHEALIDPKFCAFLQSVIVLLAEPNSDTLKKIVNVMVSRLSATLDENVKNAMVAELEQVESGRLALLSFTLRILYDERKRNALNAGAYKRLGGAAKAIGVRAREAFDTFITSADKDALLHRLFASLVQKFGDPPLRRRAVLSALTNNAPEMNELIATFCRPDVGLLTKSGDLIEVSHEVVFEHFTRFKDWIDANRTALDAAAAVENAAQEWGVSDRGVDGLWSQRRVKRVTADIQKSPEVWERLAPEAKDFLNPDNFTKAFIAELDRDETTDERREQIGKDLNDLLGGDPRKGTGAGPDGYPDFEWLYVKHNPKLLLRLEHRSYMGAVDKLYMSKYPITRAQFRAFRMTGYTDAPWWNNRSVPDRASDDKGAGNEPVTGVKWAEAMAFAQWANQHCPVENMPDRRRDGWRIRLPTEWEWLQAATGGSAVRFPWNASTFTEALEDPFVMGRVRRPRRDVVNVSATAVGLFPCSPSPFGVSDLIGNVQELCLNLFQEADPRDGHVRDYHPLRGGVIDNTVDGGQGTCQFRTGLHQAEFGPTIGFRLVYGPGDPEVLARLTVQDWARGG